MAMGGRAAEELSMCCHSGSVLIRCSTSMYPVYGPDNVTSGASSDIRNATSTASAMVRVCLSSVLVQVIRLAHRFKSISGTRTKSDRYFTTGTIILSARKKERRLSQRSRGKNDRLPVDVCL